MTDRKEREKVTKVTAWTDGEGRYAITAEGHAAGSVGGCGFISGILYALAGYLNASAPAQVEECRMEPGDVSLRFRGGARAEAAWEMAVIGLGLLEESYPEIVHVEEGRSVIAPSSVSPSGCHLPPRGKA